MTLNYNKMMTENILNSEMRESFTTISDGSSPRESLPPSYIDLEKQELRGILKRPYKGGEYTPHVIKHMLSFVPFLACFPIVICDLFYGYNKNSCVEDYPHNLNINMKIYLVVGAYTSILIMGLVVSCISCVSNRAGTSTHLWLVTVPKLIITYGSLFLLAWNIIGAVLFWGLLYNKNLCDNNTSTYLFITLIIKLVCNLTVLASRRYA
jgi:hypothetical protein